VRLTGQDKSEPVSRPCNRLALSRGREGVFTAPLDFTVSVTAADGGWVKARLSDGRNTVRRVLAMTGRTARRRASSDSGHRGGTPTVRPPRLCARARWVSTGLMLEEAQRLRQAERKDHYRDWRAFPPDVISPVAQTLPWSSLALEPPAVSWQKSRIDNPLERRTIKSRRSVRQPCKRDVAESQARGSSLRCRHHLLRVCSSSLQT